MNKYLIILYVIAIVSIAVIQPAFSQFTITTIFYPINDAWVDVADPEANHGDDVTLTIGDNQTAYLMFDLGDKWYPVDRIEMVRLRVYVCYNDHPSSNESAIMINGVSDDSWDENSITWNNKPSYDDPAITVFSDRSDYWMEVDITEIAKNVISEEDKLLSLSIRRANHTILIYSKEETHANLWPMLVVTYVDPLAESMNTMMQLFYTLLPLLIILSLANALIGMIKE